MQPGFLARMRRSLDALETVLDGVASGQEGRDRLFAARLSATGRNLREMRRLGVEVSDELIRLAACEARSAAMPGAAEAR